MRDYKKIIIKIGSSSLIKENGQINDCMFQILIKTISDLMKEDKELVLVTSGAIAFGMSKFGLQEKPKKMSLKQACAAIGQASLMNEYEKYCQEYGLLCAQILVNHNDFEDRLRMTNLSNTLNELFSNKVLPIINENDALAVEEIKVGDNDTLSALLVPMVNADLLVLASDIDGLYNKNPMKFKDARKIDIIDKIDNSIEDMIGDSISAIGTGGMKTKIKAARMVTKLGCDMAIISSSDIININKLLNGENIGTLFVSLGKKMHSKDHWIIYNTYAKGLIIVDEGAKKALLERKSLLAKGIIKTKGDFSEGSVVFVSLEDEVPFAKGITNFNSNIIDKIIGLSSKDVKDMLNCTKDEIIHANSLVLIEGDEYGKIR